MENSQNTAGLRQEEAEPGSQKLAAASIALIAEGSSLAQAAPVAANACTLEVFATFLLKRAQQVRKPAARNEANALALILLNNDAAFGERDLQDDEVRKMLKDRGIGLATMRKALTAARKEAEAAKAIGSLSASSKHQAGAKVSRSKSKAVRAPEASVAERGEIAASENSGVAEMIERSLL